MENPLREQRDYGVNQLDGLKEFEEKVRECKDGLATVDQITDVLSHSLEMKILASQVSKKRRLKNIETRPEHECSKSKEEGYETEC